MNVQMTEKIAALLAKAESTPFGPEAEAFYAKAQELMIKHAVDEAMLAAARKGAGGPDRPVCIKWAFTPNNLNLPGRKILFSSVARANRCRPVFHGQYDVSAPHFVSIVGFESDVSFVHILYTSLLLQATRESRRQWVDRKAEQREDPGSYMYSSVPGQKAYTTAFLVGYAETVVVRLQEAADRATAKATDGVVGAGLALRSRQDLVNDEVRVRFGRLSRGRSYSSDAAAHADGRRAARNADISGGRNNLGATSAPRPALAR